MSCRKVFRVWIPAVIWLLMAVPCWPQPPVPTGKLEVHFISVGQADAALIRCPDGDHYMLVDSGDQNKRYPGSETAFRNYMNQVFTGKPRRLTAVIASHPHTDHIASVKWVLDNFAVGTYVDNGQKYDSATWAALDKRVRQLRKSGKLSYVNGYQTRYGELEFCPRLQTEILVPWAWENLSNPNDRSVLVRLTYNKISFLFTGDAEEHAEEVLLDKIEPELRERLDVDVLKVGHHGSDTSSTARFVQVASPSVAVVSVGQRDVGTNSGYRHPRLSTLNTFADLFKKRPDAHPLDGKVWAYNKKTEKWAQHQRRQGIWLTIQDGTVILRSDGSSPDPEIEFKK